MRWRTYKRYEKKFDCYEDVLDAARQFDREPLLRTIWKRVLDATERAGPRIVRTVVDQVFGRLLRGKGPEGRAKRPAFGLAGQTPKSWDGQSRMPTRVRFAQKATNRQPSQ
jgi:hypothetical protein